MLHYFQTRGKGEKVIGTSELLKKTELSKTSYFKQHRKSNRINNRGTEITKGENEKTKQLSLIITHNPNNPQVTGKIKT